MGDSWSQKLVTEKNTEHSQYHGQFNDEARLRRPVWDMLGLQQQLKDMPEGEVQERASTWTPNLKKHEHLLPKGGFRAAVGLWFLDHDKMWKHSPASCQSR